MAKSGLSWKTMALVLLVLVRWGRVREGRCERGWGHVVEVALSYKDGLVARVDDKQLL